jgi:hypothetical protein
VREESVVEPPLTLLLAPTEVQLPLWELTALFRFSLAVVVLEQPGATLLQALDFLNLPEREIP